VVSGEEKKKAKGKRREEKSAQKIEKRREKMTRKERKRVNVVCIEKIRRPPRATQDPDTTLFRAEVYRNASAFGTQQQ
ncbi:hypothetical protein, partial [Salmonella enterica]|uniref:hypothetical protein n=1 Tax=Salmonella enterica TaxID=28901 RepID=UPI001AD9DD8F